MRKHHIRVALEGLKVMGRESLSGFTGNEQVLSADDEQLNRRLRQWFP